jgi:hypothetical protein
VNCVSSDNAHDGGALAGHSFQGVGLTLEQINLVSIDERELGAAMHANEGAISGGSAQCGRVPGSTAGTGHHSFESLLTDRFCVRLLKSSCGDCPQRCNQ